MGVLGNCNFIKVCECIACCGGIAMDLAKRIEGRCLYFEIQYDNDSRTSKMY